MHEKGVFITVVVLGVFVALNITRSLYCPYYYYYFTIIMIIILLIIIVILAVVIFATCSHISLVRFNA